MLRVFLCRSAHTNRKFNFHNKSRNMKEKRGLICSAHVDQVSLELCDLMRRINNRCLVSLCSRKSLLVL